RERARTDESAGDNQWASNFDGSPVAGGYNQGRGTTFTLRNGRMSMTRLLPLAAALGVLASLAPAAPPEKFTFVDLKPYANQKIPDNFGSGREGNSLKALGKDGRTLAGVNFKIGEGLIQLGSKLLNAEKPNKVEGIKVGKACARVHVLHATGYGNGQTI